MELDTTSQFNEKLPFDDKGVQHSAFKGLSDLNALKT
jgi:hypothetical protein